MRRTNIRATVWRGQLRLGAVIGLGLLLALAATLAPPPAPGGDPGASLTIRLPDALRVAVIVLLALSAVLLLALQRPRRPAGDDPLLERVYRKRSSWMALLSLLPLLVLLLLWYVVWNGADEDAHPIERAVTAIAGLLDLLSQYRKPPTSVPLFDATVAVLVLTFAVCVFALMVVVTLADRLERWWAGGAPSGAASPVAAGADDVDDLRAVPDVRLAIVRAYGRLERALAAARAPRAPSQTPGEFMRATLDHLPLPRAAVERLTMLFELARFSDRPLSAEARDAACDSLDEITAALDASEAERAR